MVLGVVRPKWPWILVPKKWNLCLMRGLSMDSPCTVLRTAKKSGLMAGLKFVHVFCLYVIA